MPTTVSIPNRDYRLFRVNVVRNERDDYKFQSLIGIIGYFESGILKPLPYSVFEVQLRQVRLKL